MADGTKIYNVASLADLTTDGFVKTSGGAGDLSVAVPLAGTKVYYVSDSSGGSVDRKLTFVDGLLTSET